MCQKQRREPKPVDRNQHKCRYVNTILLFVTYAEMEGGTGHSLDLDHPRDECIEDSSSPIHRYNPHQRTPLIQISADSGSIHARTLILMNLEIAGRSVMPNGKVVLEFKSCEGSLHMNTIICQRQTMK